MSVEPRPSCDLNDNREKGDSDVQDIVLPKGGILHDSCFHLRSKANITEQDRRFETLIASARQPQIKSTTVQTLLLLASAVQMK